jgi:hypothetical protein
MAERRDPNVEGMLELSIQEMERLQGGAQVAFFLKLDGVDGDVSSIRHNYFDGRLLTAADLRS